MLRLRRPGARSKRPLSSMSPRPIAEKGHELKHSLSKQLHPSGQGCSSVVQLWSAKDRRLRTVRHSVMVVDGAKKYSFDSTRTFTSMAPAQKLAYASSASLTPPTSVAAGEIDVCIRLSGDDLPGLHLNGLVGARDPFLEGTRNAKARSSISSAIEGKVNDPAHLGAALDRVTVRDALALAAAFEGGRREGVSALVECARSLSSPALPRK